MKLFFSFVIFFIMMFGCKQTNVKAPKDLISEATMENLLYELAIMSSARGFNGGKLDEKYEVPLAYLYQKFGVDSTQFANSNTYYAAKPEVYINIYKRVETRLKHAKEQAEASKKLEDSLKNQRKNKKDSLKLKNTTRDTVSSRIKT